ncbi:MAG: S-methyl-5-thioribose-1-phosphate isomerase [Ruminococcaceae bacterium]|nr:S-methyl-5-thioribose-1-phosphate isomerase [Oscillospiraceae bacterium]
MSINEGSVVLSKDKNCVEIIDQTLLPLEERIISLSTPEEIYDAIYYLKVRGAPAIGICAGYGMYVLAKQIKKEPFLDELLRLGDYLNSSRPTAVNLSFAVNRLCNVAKKNILLPREELLELMRLEAEKIHKEDIEMCRSIATFGLELVKAGDTILTHCNAGPLATSKYGTGLGTFFLAKEKGIELKAYCDETRPLLQGARLTVYELQNAGVDCTLICDNMAAALMKQGKIDACFVGCDRVALNGDAANKIGTLGVAVLAKHYGVPFYVFCPSSTVDKNCKTGDDIVIEERKSSEIFEMFYEKPVAREGTKCYNPAFDVTDHELITAIVTEKGIWRGDESFETFLRRKNIID